MFVDLSVLATTVSHAKQRNQSRCRWGRVVRPKDGSKLCYLANTTERSVCARVATMRAYVKLLCALVIITVYANLRACVLVLDS